MKKTFGDESAEHPNSENIEQFEATGGKISNREIMAQARGSLKGRWGLAIGTVLVYWIICIAAEEIPKAGWLISILVSGAMSLGLCIFALSLSRRKNPKFEQLFGGFKRFGVALAAFLLKIIFIILWSLLLVVPGIIASFRYSMTYYIIAENDSIGPLEAIKKSKEMMRGNKWKLFCLCWRFIGWDLLCILTLGIGFLWLMPYRTVAFARFYDDVAV